jgi:cyanophycinase-like exopeptidase
MILGGWIPARPAAATFSIWQPAFGLVPNTVVLPHFDEMPRWLTTPLGWTRPRRSVFLGIDGGTALVGSDATWQILGRGRVVVRGGGTDSPFNLAARG